jgi:hypothetical protein
VIAERRRIGRQSANHRDLAICFYVRRLKYAVMMTTSKSMTPIARRKKPKDGSGMPVLRILLAFVIASELWSNGLVPAEGRCGNIGRARILKVTMADVLIE